MRGGRLLLGLAIAAMAVLSHFAYRERNPVTGEIQLSPEQEVALGLQSIPEMAQQFGGLDPDPAVQQNVQGVGERVVSESVVASTPYQFRFYVLADRRTVNAFALPGGPVFITRALLSRLQNEAQLAGVLGHEVGHVVGRHSAEQTAEANLTRGPVNSAGAGTADHASQPAALHMAAMVGRMMQLKYGRGDELEADQLGVQLMSEAGYDPRALIGVMNILATPPSGGSQPEFTSTHPDPGNRAERIQDEIAKRFPDGVPSNLMLGKSLVGPPDPPAMPPT